MEGRENDATRRLLGRFFFSLLDLAPRDATRRSFRPSVRLYKTTCTTVYNPLPPSDDRVSPRLASPRLASSRSRVPRGDPVAVRANAAEFPKLKDADDANDAASDADSRGDDPRGVVHRVRVPRGSARQLRRGRNGINARLADVSADYREQLEHRAKKSPVRVGSADGLDCRERRVRGGSEGRGGAQGRVSLSRKASRRVGD